MRLTLKDLKKQFKDFQATKEGKDRFYYPNHLRVLAVNFSRSEEISFSQLARELGIAANTMSSWSSKLEKSAKNKQALQACSPVQLRVIGEPTQQKPKAELVQKEGENVVVFVMKKENLNSDFFRRIKTML